MTHAFTLAVIDLTILEFVELTDAHMKMQLQVFIIIIIVFVSDDASRTCVISAHPTSSDLTDDVISDDTVSDAGAIADGIQLLQTLLKSYMCKKHLALALDKLDDSAADKIDELNADKSKVSHLHDIKCTTYFATGM